MHNKPWTEEEDKILADNILKAIREGYPKTKAFKDTAKQIRRTAGSVGFRWNAKLSKKYEVKMGELIEKRLEENNYDSITSINKLSYKSLVISTHAPLFVEVIEDGKGMLLIKVSDKLSNTNNKDTAYYVDGTKVISNKGEYNF